MLTYDLIKSYADRRYYMVRDLPFIKYEYQQLSGFFFRKHPNSWNPVAEASPGFGAAVQAGVPGRRIAFLGGAQLFGIYTEDSVPFGVAHQLSCQCLNLGAGGAGPEFYIGRPDLIKYVNQCDAAVIAFMAGRSVSVRDYTISPNANNHWKQPGNTSYTDSLKILQALWESGTDASRKELGDEIRESYTAKMLQLIGLIDCPKVLLWISQRHHHEISDSGSSFGNWIGRFPYLIDTPCFERLIRAVDGLAYAVSPPVPRILTAMPREQRCTNMPNGRVEDTYYPNEYLTNLATAETTRELRRILGL